MSMKTVLIVALTFLALAVPLSGCTAVDEPATGGATDTAADVSSGDSADATALVVAANETAAAEAYASGTDPAWIPELPTPTYIPTPIGRVVADEFPTATPVPTGPGVIRYDGLYSAKIADKPQGWYYLRFYPDGTVISTIGYGDPIDTGTWFTKGANHTGTGTYTVDDRRLVFSTQRNDNDHIKEWEGEIQGDVLEMEIYAYATGIRWPARYRFAAVPILNPPSVTATPQ